MTFHAQERATERLTAAGINPATVLSEASRIARVHADRDLAVRMRVLDTPHGDLRADVMSRESNGNEVWAVLRRGRVVTLMLRRSTQPRTREAFGVDAVAHIDFK